jgi:hypothetical protein
VEEEVTGVMALAEFKAKQEAMKKAGVRIGLWPVIYGGLAFALVILLEKFGHWVPTPARPLGVVFLIGLCLGGLAIFVSCFIKLRRLGKQFGLSCPNCHKSVAVSIAGRFHIRTIMASGRCGHCGALVLDDWDK